MEPPVQYQNSKLKNQKLQFNTESSADRLNCGATSADQDHPSLPLKEAIPESFQKEPSERRE
jgi:hypothetical protein